MPLLQKLREAAGKPKILLLGSGGLSIGQAGEFDYSGSQAIKAIIEEGFEVVVVNPNIATVQTNPQPGVTVYLYPVEVPWVEKVIAVERPHAIMAGFGGQTALNCLLGLDKAGVLAEYGVTNLGTPPEVLRMTEDRDEFAAKMNEIGMPIPQSTACENFEQARDAAERIGYPVIVRAAYALGGLGSGFASNEEELENLVVPALVSSPQVLIEKSFRGWKEVEYEVMRDSEGNTIAICNMENFDPLGIHTGDSIVVAPSQTLSDEEFQLLRDRAINIVNELGVVGECNVQYSLDPYSSDFFVIEVNARLSRSSALASKATGYPIAYIAAKVVMGYDLLELKNPVTGITCAFFEPAMDYLVLKMPRWDLGKFAGVSRLLGSTMKSVGEVMAIGRSFPEILQKAVRMVTENPLGLTDSIEFKDEASLNEALSNPTDKRVFAVMEAFRRGMSIDQVYELSRINRWFLYHMKQLAEIETSICKVGAQWQLSRIEKLSDDFSEQLRGVDFEKFHFWKILGFSDEQIATLLLRDAQVAKEISTEAALVDLSLAVRRARVALGVVPVTKKIDTTAGEYLSPSNYLYMTYHGKFHDEIPEDHKILSAVVLGGGAYRIGTSVEFDWCAVSCSKRLQSAGWRSVIVNCNPETVSTDYNSSDRLYFEELSLERILDIFDVEKPVGVIASMGGQQPNRLAMPLAKAGVKLMGHSAATVDMAEDRSRFSGLLDDLGIDQPRWIAARSRDEIGEFIAEVGYPVLVRPSYVLSGAAMRVAYEEQSLQRQLAEACDVSPHHPVVISEFIEGAREIELDGIACKGEVVTAIVSEHVENAGIHSGDATTVVPAQKLYVETARKIRRAGLKIAQGLRLNGPFNIQFLAKDGEIKVIECNARAARSFPFVSKTVGLNLADVATDVILGVKPSLDRFNEDDLPYVGVKAAMFSFGRLGGADPVLGVEMASTGEVGCIGHDIHEALLLALQATGNKAPQKGVLVSSGPERDKLKFVKSAEVIRDLGLPIYATPGTAAYLSDHGIEVTKAEWPGEGEEDVIGIIKSGKVDFVINIPKNSDRQELTRGFEIRQAAIKFGCGLLTNMEKATAFVAAIGKQKDRSEQTPIKLAPYRNQLS